MNYRFSVASIIDIEEIYDYLEGVAGQQTADMVIDEIKRVIKDVLSENPNLGTMPQTSIENLLFFPAGKYPRYQIYYRLIDDTLEVYRVLHGKRDVTNILDES